VSAYAGGVDVWDFSVAEEDEGDEDYEDVVSEVDIARRRISHPSSEESTPYPQDPESVMPRCNLYNKKFR
jgi:hypothetical protein